MDLLSQYQQEHPEPMPQPLAHEPDGNYGFFIRLVMRLSGGRIRDARTASRALLFGGTVIAIIATYLFISAIGGDTGTPLPYEQTYKPFQ